MGPSKGNIKARSLLTLPNSLAQDMLAQPKSSDNKRQLRCDKILGLMRRDITDRSRGKCISSILAGYVI